MVLLKDGNIPYLQSKHLFLTVIISLVFIFIFLPYTLLLLSGYKLYRYSNTKYFRWVNKVKPLLDSYYAPYKKQTRYWTGFLLLVRCVLYIVFSLEWDTSKSLLAIITVFTGIASLAWLSGRIYTNFYIDIIEASIHLNLIILSSLTLGNINRQALSYTLVGIVFATMIGIILCQFYHLYISKSARWLKIKSKIQQNVQHPKTLTETDTPSANATSENPPKEVSKTFIELRELLLEN